MTFFVPSDDALKKRIIFVMFEKRIADVNAATQISLCENMEPYISFEHNPEGLSSGHKLLNLLNSTSIRAVIRRFASTNASIASLSASAHFPNVVVHFRRQIAGLKFSAPVLPLAYC
ncbi:hypothetical protein TNCV_3101091 [Trichonephila clavipes]|nr:hypothetical protein TNCV_3101091 [Trichonephila clavipes]